MEGKELVYLPCGPESHKKCLVACPFQHFSETRPGGGGGGGGVNRGLCTYWDAHGNCLINILIDVLIFFNTVCLSDEYSDCLFYVLIYVLIVILLFCRHS